MANGRRRPIAPVRKLVAAVLGTFATFIILFGAGMMSWAIVALGVALLVLALSFLVITALRRGARAWVAGVAHVHSASEPPASSTYGRAELQIVIDAPGLPPRSVKVRDPRVPVAKWPSPGATLPIMVAIDDARHVRILWDDVPTHAEASASGAGMSAGYPAPEPFDDDELLIDQNLPPWQRRDPDDDFGPSVDSMSDITADLGPPLTDPVIIHQEHRTPGKPIVLEGTLVESGPSVPPPLPKRAKPSPHRPRQRTGDPAEPAGSEPAPVQPANLDLDKPAAGSMTAAGSTAATAGAASTGTAGPVTSSPVTGIDPPADGPSIPPAGATSNFPAGATVSTPAGATALADPPDTRSGTTARHTPADHDDFDFDLDLGPATGHDVPGPASPGPTPGAGPTTAGGIISGSGMTVTVADLPRSVAFYRDLLGFQEIDGSTENAVLASGNTRLVLWSTPGVTPVNRRLTHLNLDVSDVQSAYRQLRANGVRFTSEPRVVNQGTRVEQWVAAFKDPDGHGIALTEWRDRTP